MRLQQSGGFNLSTLSVEQLTDMLKNKALAQLAPAIQAELNERNKTKAVLTVEVLKSFTAKPVLDGKKEPTGNYRIQGKVVSAKLINPGPNDELTYGFGPDFKETANISVFMIVSEELLDSFDSSISTHVTVEAALTVNPNIDGAHFLLSAGTIDELRTVYVEAERRNRSFKVWKNAEGQEFLGKQGPEGYTPNKVASYGNISVIDVLEVNPVNLALTNSVIPEDKLAWIKQANAEAKRSTENNLLAYQARQAADRNSNTIVNDTLKDVAIPSKEEDVAIAI